MSILTAGQPSLTKRQPSLAIAAREAAAERQRSARQASPIKRWTHRTFAVLAIVFASLTVFGSSAQAAWPWELVENGMKWAVTACGPNDVPTPHNRSGNYTQTVVPQFGGNAGNGGSGLDRISAAARQAHVGNPGNSQDATSLIAGVQHHGYERYGYSTLGWDAYGSSCFVGPGQLFTAPVNALFNIFVTLPAMVLTSIMNFALSNVFYDMFWGWVSPFMALFANIFAPWVLAIVLVGGAVVILLRSKGSLTRILQLTAWMLAMLGLFFGIQNQGLGEKVRSLSNNFVTQAVNLIACQVTTANIGGTNVATPTTSSCGLQPTSSGVGVDGIDLTNPSASSPGASFRISGGIDQAIWYSIPYQVWSQGTVGTAQSFADRNLTEQGRISWSAAILNAKHVDRNDALGRQVDLYSGLWNQAGYNATGDDGGQKMRIWTDPDDKGWRDEDGQPNLKAWDTVPYLGVVKAMCNDVATGEGKSEDLGQNRWGYMGNCDAAGAGVGFLPTFKGDAFWERGSAVMSGSVALTVTMIPLIFVAFYLMVQRMLGYFILMFAPLFIGIGAFPDEKRMGFVKRYGELFLGNLIKQILAMCLVLFVLTGVSGVLNASVAVAWYLKPVAVIMFALGLLMFAIPLSRILKAAAKGDTSVVDKTLNAPQRAAKTTAKVAGVAAIAGATLGAGAIASGAMGLGSAAAGGGAAGAATGAGMAGLKAGIGGVAKAGLGGVAKSAATGLKGGLSQKGLQGAAAGLTRMVKNGDALKMLRYSGMGDSALGQTLRKGLAFGQVGLNVVGKNSSNPAVDKGLLRARSEGIDLLDANDRMSGSPIYARDEHGELTPEGRRQAEEDYDAIYRGDPEGEAADKAASDAQRTLYANYRKMNPGQYLPGDPSDPSGVGRPRTPQETAESVASTMSTSSWGTQVLRTKVKTGEEILQAAGGTEALLSGDKTGPALDKIFAGYGNMANIDPAHPAAGSFVNLAFASRSNDAEYKEAAFADFIAQVNEHGVPDRIGGFHATAEFAAGHNPATVLAAMPSLSPESTMAERAQAAGNFTVAAMTVPQDAPFRQALDSYRSALLDPDMNVGAINELKSALARDISAADNAAMAQASSAFVGTTDGTTGFRINGESTLDWKDAPPAAASATALVGVGAATATAAAPAPAAAAPAPAAQAAQAPAAPAPAAQAAQAPAAPAAAAQAPTAQTPAAPAPAAAAASAPAAAAQAPASESTTATAPVPSETPRAAAPQAAATPAAAGPQAVRVISQPAPAARGNAGASAEAGITEEMLNERLTEQAEAIVEQVQGAVHEAVMEANAETHAANGRLAETAKKPRSSGLFKKDRER